MVARIVVALLTVVAIGCLVYQSADQLQAQPLNLAEIDFHWWVLAVVAYLGAMLLSSLFWHRVLIVFKQQPAVLDSLTAFFASQLGKYIPGKAMVVVIRTDLIRGKNVSTKAAAASVFVETLAWLFTGAAIASVLMLVRYPGNWPLQLTAVGLMLTTGVVTWPPVFQKIATRFSSIGKNKSVNIFSGLTLPTMMGGWLILSIGWLLNGASLWLVIKGLPNTAVTLDHYWLTLTCVSLATVAGFASLLPGGIGVREVVLIPLLGPAIGPANAIIAAIVIRLVWLTTETLGAASSYLARGTTKAVGKQN